MAILSNAQALQLIKEPRHQKEIQRAREKRIRHKLHTEAETDTSTRSQSASNFLGWVQNVLGSDPHFQRFCQLCRPPYATNELVEGIFTSFEKIFESRNGFEKFDFSDPQLEQDFREYRKKLGDFTFWETQGMEAFKNSIDNILIVDLPRLPVDQDGDVIQETERPEPYYYLLDIDRLIDIESGKIMRIDEDLEKEFYFFKTEYIIFREPGPKKEDGLIYVFDDEHYRVYQESNSGDPQLISEHAHELGFCPARSFWTTPLNSDTDLLKRGPITNSLSQLDWLLFFQVAEQYLQLYAPFPIYAMYRKKCDYKEKSASGEAGRSCVAGWLEWPGNRAIGSERVQCPKCKEAGRVGPGHIIFVDPPRDKGEDADLMSQPIKVIPAEVTSLDYIRTRIAELKAEIRVNCVGRSTDTNEATAKNELQVESGFESSEAILLKAKRNFEIVHEFALDTIARLRYGPLYLGGVVNYGDEFLQKSEAEEMAEYASAVSNKLPVYELSERRRDIFKARYRNDPKKQQRLEVLEHLEPFPDMTIGELVELRKSAPALVAESDVIIKMHFNEFINRFERERAPLTQFGSAIDFDVKINLIREDLLAYAAEYKSALAPVTVPPGDGVPA